MQRKEAQTIMDADYADGTALLEITPAQTKTLLHGLERAAAGIALHVNADKTEYICFNQSCDISNQERRQHVTIKSMDSYR